MIRMKRLPLDGVRIVDTSYVFAGPYAAGLLCDLGAEVIKIEGPSRPDQTRGGQAVVAPDDQHGSDPWNRTSSFNLANRGKKSLVLDLARKEGRDVLADLIKTADVVLENFTPRVMRGWGLDYPNLQRLNPRIIMVSNTGYGHGGPYSSYPAQATTQEATHGLAAITGYRGSTPSKAGQSFVDFLATWNCMTAILLGLRFRHRFGRGLWADLGMYQLGCFGVSEYVLDHIANGTSAERMGNRHRQYAPQGCYRCDGKDAWCVISVRDDAEWQALCSVIERPELAHDPRYATTEARRLNHDAIDTIIGQWSAALTKIEAMERLQAAGVPAGAVLDGRDLNLDPQLNHRGLLEWVQFPPEREMGSRRLIIGRPWRFSKEAVKVRGPAPKFGQHNREVLRDILKYDDERIGALEREEIVADKPKKMREMLSLTVEEQVKMGRLAYRDAEYKKRLGME